MNTPNQILELQGQLSTWSSTKKTAGWGAIVLLVVCVADVAVTLTGKEGIGGPSTVPFLLFAMCLIFRVQAARKIYAINAELSS